MGLFNAIRDCFRDPTPKHIRDHLRQQREDRRHHEREVWREEAQRAPYVPPPERNHPDEPDRGHGGGGW
jgi:hypothetical protein